MLLVSFFFFLGKEESKKIQKKRGEREKEEMRREEKRSVVGEKHLASKQWSEAVANFSSAIDLNPVPLTLFLTCTPSPSGRFMALVQARPGSSGPRPAKGCGRGL